MRTNFFITLLLLMSGSVRAQQNAEQAMDYSFYESMTSRVHYVNEAVGEQDATTTIQAYVKKHINTQVELKQTYAIKSLTGWHYTFAQLYKGIEVYNGELKAHVNLRGKLYLIQENLINTTGWGNLTEISNEIPAKVAERFNVITTNKQQVVYVYNGQPRVAWQLGTYSNVRYQSIEYVVDKDFNVLYSRDLKRYFTTPQDSVVKAKVFLPDPMTTAEAVYGDPYLDRNDSNVQELNDERIEVDLTTRYELDTFHLKNDYIFFGEVSPPLMPVYKPTVANFDFGRGDDEFEFINVFYHLDTFSKYMSRLGCGALLATIKVDPHAYNGSDQSGFDPNVTPYTLEYGDGGVDDGEDADVIIHEYGHSFAEVASPKTFVGAERISLEEGLCDYLAASYSRSFSEYNWEQMFNWDGHNEYWDGRMVTTTKIYPDDLGSDIHYNGEIFSSALMESWELTGREELDKIYFESLYFLTKNQTMREFAYIMLKTDTLLNGGANYTQLMLGFVHRKLIPDWKISVGDIQPEPTVKIYGSFEFSSGSNNAIIKAVGATINKITVTDALGKAVYSTELINEGTVTLNPVNFNTGIYFVKVSTDNKEYTFKLIRY